MSEVTFKPVGELPEEVWVDGWLAGRIQTTNQGEWVFFPKRNTVEGPFHFLDGWAIADIAQRLAKKNTAPSELRRRATNGSSTD
jgi:hypothetical protein